MVTTHHTPDDIDLAIIDELVTSPRRSYSALAESVGLSAGATKARVRQLRESQRVRIAGRVDPTILGHGLFAFAFIEVRGSVMEVAESLGRLHETAFVAAVGGNAGLIVELRCRDWSHLMRALDEVRNDSRLTETRVAILVSYHKQDWSRFHSGGVVPSADDDRPAYAVDAIDMDILKVLAEDGRATYADIARRVAVSQGTARQRVRHLEAAGAVTVQTIVSPGILGLSGYAAVGVSADGPSEAVAKEAARLAPVALVAAVLGAFDIVAEVGYRDLGQLAETLDSLRSIPGVKHVESFPYLVEVKESMEAGLWGS